MNYLARHQRADGSWIPLWFGNQQHLEQTNPVLGTARVLRAFEELKWESPAAQRGVAYLLGAQNPDGGWGGSAGVASSPEETALALTALAGWTACDGVPEAMERGTDHVIRCINDGALDRPTPIGLYFASLWYSEKLYPIIWTLEALGRVRRARTANPHHAAQHGEAHRHI